MWRLLWEISAAVLKWRNSDSKSGEKEEATREKEDAFYKHAVTATRGRCQIGAKRRRAEREDEGGGGGGGGSIFKQPSRAEQQEPPPPPTPRSCRDVVAKPWRAE